MDERKFKLVAPDIDDLLNGVEKSIVNPEPQTKEINERLIRLTDTLRDLAPTKPNGDIKAIWLMIPRGNIEDWLSFEDAKEYYEFTDDQEYEDRWKSEYPNEECWYRLIVSEYKGFIGVSLGGNYFIGAETQEPPVDFDRYYGYMEILLDLINESAQKSMDMLRDGTYNNYVANNLPFWLRTGIIKRSDWWKHFPEYRSAIWEGLDDDTFRKFAKFSEMDGQNSEILSEMISPNQMTGNTFLRACAIGYKACGMKGTDLSLIDQYLLHADGRDEGFTGKTHDPYHRGVGIDMDSPEAWEDWYFNRPISGGHPWEVCRGGNSTHIDLSVSPNSEAFYRRCDLKGWHFSVAGNAWNRAVEAVKFYVAIKEAGYPVILHDAKAILDRFNGADYVGIVPRTRYPFYCDDLFPDEYPRMLDYMNLEDDEFEKAHQDITWLPIEPEHLKEKELED